ncbi:unnamed protein product [Pedinophyceae sp. YPF-701]|nr:unnamed protein product [Pedinophyceae sp. YPF-701]
MAAADTGPDEVQSILSALRDRVSTSTATELATGYTPSVPSATLYEYAFEDGLREVLRGAVESAWQATSGAPRTDPVAARVALESDGRTRLPQALPRPVQDPPPAHADSRYKVVALVDGVPTSIYDASTQYPIGQTLMQRARPDHGGGMYVFRSVEDCLARDAAVFGRGGGRRELDRCPRAIIRCRCWLEGRHEQPVRYGHKEAYTFLRAEEVLPMPPQFHHERDLADLRREDGLTALEPREVAQLWHAGTERARTIVAKQARNIQLQREVEEMEEAAELLRQHRARLAGAGGPQGPAQRLGGDDGAGPSGVAES